MGNRQKKKQAAAEFNRQRLERIAEQVRAQEELAEKLKTPEGRAEYRRERQRVRSLFAFAGMMGAGALRV